MTTTKADIKNPVLEGEYFAVMLAHEGQDLHELQSEFNQIIKKVTILNSGVKSIHIYADTLLAALTRQIIGGGDLSNTSDRMVLFYIIVTGLGLLFMMLPTLNLVNINLSRIMERSSEIGVRKAFGATGRALMGQFLIENIFLTLVGGLLGLALAYGALRLISGSDFIAYAQFSLSLPVFGWALLITLVFGIMSGVYPALKMSRLQPVNALKGGAK
jgi:putative ABC transport system permease protein